MMATDAMMKTFQLAAAENTRLRQALWDIYGILGFDQDGDPTPEAVAGDVAALVVDAARQFRAFHDEFAASVGALLRAEELVKAAAEAPCLLNGDRDQMCGRGTWAHPVCALTAAFAALPECEEARREIAGPS